jgi:aminoglycoside 6'-N-acetyltransferase
VRSSYTFHPLSAADLPRVRQWLAAPHVAEWWGDPDEQFELVRGDLHHPSMNQFIVAIDERPLAYLQCYQPSAWPNHGFGAIADGARGIDQFIGEPDLISQGHGSGFIRAFADDLISTGTARVVTDPSPLNVRAFRAYENAGFRGHCRAQTPDGPEFLMVRDA